MSASAIVVGGGPAGALLAFLLASRGIDTTLVERQSNFAREFRGEGLMPGGQAMFRETGLWDAFDALPHTRFRQACAYYKGKRLLSVDLAQAIEDAPRWVSQPAMLEMLVDQASRFATFNFLRGVPVAAPLLRDDRVAGVELSAHDEDRLEADYVFACDGRLSTLRRDCGLDQPRNPEFFDIVWCKLPMPDFYDADAPDLRAYIGNRHLGLFIPAYDGLLQVGWVIPKGGYKEMRGQGIENWLEQIAGHVSGDLAAHIRRNASGAVRPFLLDVVCDCFDRWSVPGMTLLGDAAHPMSPVGAQGINIALRDAVVAANCFLPPLLGGADAAALDAAAAAFREQRIAEVEPIQALQRRAPRILFGNPIRLATIARLLPPLQRAGILAWFTRRFDGGPNAFFHGVADVRLDA